ncbi:hypothetical protein EV128_1351 [Rhizobium azibense]|nr:hypothetical protein EV128_1351 [Rhizobium azibense]
MAEGDFYRRSTGMATCGRTNRAFEATVRAIKANFTLKSTE